MAPATDPRRKDEGRSLRSLITVSESLSDRLGPKLAFENDSIRERILSGSLEWNISLTMSLKLAMSILSFWASCLNFSSSLINGSFSISAEKSAGVNFSSLFSARYFFTGSISELVFIVWLRFDRISKNLSVLIS
ncbi:hypothetical protein OGATHE_001921 [Ogataea polymorpha]|uniref:Uncharacterized protein n=1 Tax=Ogataea polymorpha TaxID=460523 RepID=A0A9P8TD53_9ASCO|nr:hypothetical protein OGATHE_001921 [Ogataea polymorpha]